MARDIEAGRAFVRVGIKENLAGLRKISNKLKTWGSSLAGIGAKMSIAMAGINVPLALAVKNFADFDDAMLAVKGVTQASASDFQKLTEKAKALGASTSFTAVEVAALMGELGRAGFSPDQINEMTEAVLNLSRATGTEATLASGIMAATIRQFGMEASDAARVADALTTAANKSFNTVEALGEAMSYAGPVARDFGMSIEDTLAVLGALGNVGIQGSNAGTALRRLLIITGAEAQKMEGIFGGSFRDAAGNALPLIDILQRINEATKNLGSGQRAEKLNEAFGLLGITGASALSNSVADIGELRKALSDAGGAAAKTAAEMDSGLGGSLRILMSAVEGVKIAFGAALAPVLQRIGAIMTNVSGAVKTFIDANQGVAVAFAGVVAALSAAAIAITTLGVTMWGAGAALGGIVSILSAIISPLGIVIGLVSAGTAAFLTFTDAGQYIVQVLRDDFGQALGSVTETMASIKEALAAGDIKLAAQIGLAGLELAFLEATRSIRTKWHEFVRWIVDAFVVAAKAITSVFRRVASGVMQVIGVAKSQHQEDLMKSALDNLESRRGSMTEREYKVEKARIQEEGAAGMLAPLREADARMQSINDLTNSWDKALDETAAGSEQAMTDAIAAGEARIRALREQLSAARTEAKTAAGQSSTSTTAPTPRQAANVIAAAVSAMPTASQPSGTFSAQAAGLMFGNRQDGLRDIAENTKQANRHLRSIERNMVFHGNAFS